MAAWAEALGFDLSKKVKEVSISRLYQFISRFQSLKRIDTYLYLMVVYPGTDNLEYEADLTPVNT